MYGKLREIFNKQNKNAAAHSLFHLGLHQDRPSDYCILFTVQPEWVSLTSGSLTLLTCHLI